MRFYNTIVTRITLIFFMTVQMLFSCQKNGDTLNKNEYMEFDIVSNSLQVPIRVLEYGIRKKYVSNTNTIIDTTILMAEFGLLPGGIFEARKRSVCYSNCSESDDTPEDVSNWRNSPFFPVYCKIIIDNKVKIDTSCNHSLLATELRNRCGLDKKNYWNFDKRTKIIDESNKTIQYIYKVDSADLEEAK